VSNQPHLALEIDSVRVTFGYGDKAIVAVCDVSLSVAKGEIVAIVGESGCGKTTIARCALGLQPFEQGSIKIDGEPVTGFRRDAAMRVGMVWQDPTASLDPRWRIQRSVQEPLDIARLQKPLGPLLEDVGLNPELASRFPHQLSGGQRQRAAIARALAAEPPLVICDEPTAALDLSVQAQILNLIRSIQQRRNCAFLYISHDLLSVRFLADRVYVMVSGEVVESGDSEQVFSSPKHPYTRALLDAVPTLENLGQIPKPLTGEPSQQSVDRRGCIFYSRCPKREPVCETEAPPEENVNGHLYKCHFPIH
jgi:oligopeptide/dipeptide ABC transporter ATP-binding protein